jgi:hypothetical protein
MAILGGCIKSCLSKNSTNKAQDTISANQKAQTEIPKKTDDEKKKEWRAKIDKWEKHFRKLREEIGIGKVTFLIDSVSFCDMPPQTVNQSKVKTGKTYLSFKVVAYNKSDKKACLLFSVYDHEKDKYSTIYLNLAASNPFPVFLKPDQKTFGDITTEVDKNKKYSIVLLDGENEQLFMINIPEAAYNENNKSK